MGRLGLSQIDYPNLHGIVPTYLKRLSSLVSGGHAPVAVNPGRHCQCSQACISKGDTY